MVALFFSINWYSVATTEIDRALIRQEKQLRDRGGFSFIGPPDRRDQLSAAKGSIIFRLVTANIVIVTLGGAGSYLLAKRTLQPIKEAHQAQERFTSDASHELRTPLTSLISETEVTLRDKSLTIKGAKETLQSNLEELQGMAELTNSLLMLTSQQKIKQQDLKNVIIASLVSSVSKRLRHHAAKKDIDIKINIGSSVKANAHPESIKEMLTILIDNAIKYSPKGSQVIIDSQQKKDCLRISVIDAGIGIRANDIPHVFDRFYRADQSRSKIKSKGYGLGLAIAQQLAELQGTKIFAESSSGKGSTFFFELPLALSNND